MPNIWISSWSLSNHKERPAGVDIEGALVHSMGEWILNPGDGKRYYAPAWLEKLGYSAHAFIAPNGTIIKSVPTSRIAYHAGKSKFSNLNYLNRTFLGCEFLVAGNHTYSSFLRAIRDPVYTEAQYKAGGYLYASWDLLNPKITKERIVAHSFVSGDDVRGPGKGKPDPGPGFDWEQLWFWYGRYMNGEF